MNKIKKSLMALTLLLGLTFAAPQQASAASVTTKEGNNIQITLNEPQGDQKVVYSDKNVTIIVITVKVGGQEFTAVVTIDNKGNCGRENFGSDGRSGN